MGEVESGKHRGKFLDHLGRRFGIKLPKSADESAAIQSAHLVESDLSVLPREHAIDPRGKLLTAARHWRDDYSLHNPVHLVGGDDQARPRFSHFGPHSRIERSEVNSESFDRHHVHSFSSNSFDTFCQSRQSSMSSPCSATAARNISSQPSRGLGFAVLERMMTLPSSTESSTLSVRPACSITDLGSRTPRELPMRTSFAATLAIDRSDRADDRAALAPRWPDFGLDKTLVAITTL